MESESLDALKVMMEGLLKPLNEKIEGLAAENASLKEKIRQNMDLASDNGGLPNHLRPAGMSSLGNPRAARHVVVATQPVIDNPNDPLWATENIVDPGILVRNSKSGGMEGGQ